MKILHIMNELRPSGAEVMLELAAPEWQRKGCELSMIALAPTAGPQAERLKAAGWRVSHISSHGTRDLISQLTRAIREMRPDVVHLHQEGKSLALCFAVWLTKTPMLRTVHNNFPFTGVLRLRKAFERWLCRLMGSQHIAISPSVQANELEKFKNPTALCWNWFDAKEFRPPSEEESREARARLGIPVDRKVLLSVGNGSDIKNYRVVIESLSRLQDQNLHYYQVGNPHPERADERLAHQLGVADQVHFIGPRKDILDWLWACDGYVMPSIFEGYGLAAVEAIAAGCECIFADCPGLADFKEMKIQAKWEEPQASSFSRSIATLLAHPADGRDLADNAELIRQSFSVESRSLAYYDLWVSALKAPIPSS